MRIAPTVALAVLTFAGLLLLVLVAGVRDEVLVLGGLGPLIVGAQIGWFTRARIPGWLFAALPILGVLLILMGFSDYNDDGPSGPLFGPFIVIGLGAFAATALAAGVVLGASVRARG